MLQETNVTLLLVASLVLIATLGPDTFYVITRGVAQGRRPCRVAPGSLDRR